MARGSGFGYWPAAAYGSSVCALPECRKPFIMRTWDHKYCCHEHQTEANNRRSSARAKAQRKARKAA